MTATDRGVLIVEDNADDLALMLRAIERNGLDCDVLVARDGREALDHLLPPPVSNRAPSSLPAVVLLDLKLPEIDGLGVLRRIRSHERTAHLPVVILTSSIEPVDVISSYRLGANSFVRKPVGFGNLSRLIDDVARYWLMINRLPEPAETSR